MAAYLGATIEVHLRNPPHKIRGQVTEAVPGRVALKNGKHFIL